MWIPMGFNEEMQGAGAVGAVSEQSFPRNKRSANERLSTNDEQNMPCRRGDICDIVIERWGEEWVVIAVYYANGFPDAKPYLRNRRVKGFLHKEQAHQHRDQLMNSLHLTKDTVPYDSQP